MDNWWVLLGLLAMALAYWAGYTNGFHRARETDIRQIIQRRRDAKDPPPPRLRDEPSERERLEAEEQLDILNPENAHRLSRLRWREQAYKRLNPEAREEFNRLTSEWPGTPDGLRRRDEAIFEMLRRAGGDPPEPWHRR